MKSIFYIITASLALVSFASGATDRVCLFKGMTSPIIKEDNTVACYLGQFDPNNYAYTNAFGVGYYSSSQADNYVINQVKCTFTTHANEVPISITYQMQTFPGKEIRTYTYTNTFKANKITSVLFPNTISAKVFTPYVDSLKEDQIYTLQINILKKSCGDLKECLSISCKATKGYKPPFPP